MKTIKLILSAGVAGGLFAAMVAFADDAPATNSPAATNATATLPETAPPAETPPAPADQIRDRPHPQSLRLTTRQPSVTDTNTVVDPATGELKLRMRFQNAPLETVLDYISQAAGYTIVETSGFERQSHRLERPAFEQGGSPDARQKTPEPARATPPSMERTGARSPFTTATRSRVWAFR